MSSGAFFVVAALILGFALVSGRLDRTPISAPMAFLVFGWLAGPDAIGLIEADIGSELVTTLFELTLVLVLFTDASRIDLRRLGHGFSAPLRLLGLGLPLTIGAGTLAGVALLSDLSVFEALVLAVVLAPTDAALGAAVVSSRDVPDAVRQTLNVESGLNDGLVVPVLTVTVSLAAAAADPGTATEWIGFAVRQIGVALGVGVLAGWGGGRLIGVAHRTGWSSDVFERISALALSLLAFAGAEVLGGSGFMAAFLAGVAAGNLVRHVCVPLFEFSEAEGQLLTVLAFLLLGAAAAPAALESAGWRTAVYVGLSLTVVRMVPVALALAGMKLRLETILFVGWFGPRGVASVVFALAVLEEEAAFAAGEIFQVAVLTVVASTVLHGLSASPWARGYGQRALRSEAEMGPAPDLPLRHGMRGDT